MSDNRLLSSDFEKADYNSLVASINAEYCKKHGYDFAYYRPYLHNSTTIVLNNCLDPHSYKPRHASWSKILSMHKAVSHALSKKMYDYIVYIDSDCIFKDYDTTLESFVKPYLKYDIICVNDKPFRIYKPCAGFFICKVSVQSQIFLKNWYNVNIPKKNITHTWEQSALDQIFKKYNNLVLVDNSDFFNNVDGQFLRHVASHESDNRNPYFKQFIEIKDIAFTPTIERIQQIEYNTISYMKSIYKSRGKRHTSKKHRSPIV